MDGFVAQLPLDLVLNTDPSKAVAWIAIAVVLVLGFSYRGEIGRLKDRLMGELAPASPISTGPRSIVVRAGLGGHFNIDARVNGRPKLEIARDVLRKVLADWDPEISLGLVVYGHRAGSCEDIATLVPVDRGGAAPVAAALEHLGPEYRWSTRLTSESVVTDGVLDGDLVVLPGGDPGHRRDS